MANQWLYAFSSTKTCNKSLIIKHKKTKRVVTLCYHRGEVRTPIHRKHECRREKSLNDNFVVWMLSGCDRTWGVQKGTRTVRRCGNGLCRKGNGPMRHLREMGAQVVVLSPRRASNWRHTGAQGWPLCAWLVVGMHLLLNTHDNFLIFFWRFRHMHCKTAKKKKEKEDVINIGWSKKQGDHNFSNTCAQCT